LSDEAEISRDVYPGGASLMTRIGELNSANSPYIFADTDAAFAKDAQVTISDEEGTVFSGR
jgi:hypothetical protein